MIIKRKPAIFLDRDGTIIKDCRYLRKPDNVVFYSKTFHALQKLQEYFLLFIVTNQPGIAERKITKNDVNRVNNSIVSALIKRGIKITNIYVCPHRRSDNCQCIKPKTYFLKRAASDYGLDLSKCFTIGDHPHDVHLAKNASARGIYVLTGHGKKHLSELPEGTEIAGSIMGAAERIISVHLSKQSTKQFRTKVKRNSPEILKTKKGQELHRK